MNAMHAQHDGLRFPPEGCTHGQARQLVALMRSLGLPTDEVTEHHRAYLVVAGLVTDIGQSFRELADSLTMSQAQRLIRVMTLARVLRATSVPAQHAQHAET